MTRTALAFLLMTVPAQALCVLPPAQYDHAPKFKPNILWDTPEAVKYWCEEQGAPQRYGIGCEWPTGAPNWFALLPLGTPDEMDCVRRHADAHEVMKEETGDPDAMHDGWRAR